MLRNTSYLEGHKSSKRSLKKIYPYIHNGNVFVSASSALDYYISTWEHIHGEINVGQPRVQTDHAVTKIVKLLWQVILAQQNEKDNAYKSVNKSNKTMEELLAELHTGSDRKVTLDMGCLGSMSTNTLLAIDPCDVYKHQMHQWKHTRVKSNADDNKQKSTSTNKLLVIDPDVRKRRPTSAGSSGIFNWQTRSTTSLSDTDLCRLYDFHKGKLSTQTKPQEVIKSEGDLKLHSKHNNKKWQMKLTEAEPKQVLQRKKKMKQRSCSKLSRASTKLSLLKRHSR